MQNPSVYRRQAEKNENTARAAQAGYSDWAVIMCFYAALHWVNDYAFRNNEMIELKKEFYSDSFSDHTARNKYVAKIARRKNYPKLETAYKNLFEESMKARYLKDLEDEDCTATEHYSKDDVQICFEYLEQIKKGLR